MKARFDRNPRRIRGKIARELNISREQIQNILKNEVELKPLNFQKVQELTDGDGQLKIYISDWPPEFKMVMVRAAVTARSYSSTVGSKYMPNIIGKIS